MRPKSVCTKKAKHKTVFDEHDDPSVREYFLVWTTTPWTLPANVALAVHPDITYVKAKKENEVLIVARDRMQVLGGGMGDHEDDEGKRASRRAIRTIIHISYARQRRVFIVAGDFVFCGRRIGDRASCARIRRG